MRHIRSNPLAARDLDDSIERKQPNQSIHLARSAGAMRLAKQLFPWQRLFREQHIAMVQSTQQIVSPCNLMSI
ncbi:hypothetical protein RE6C_03002 [Rhodopirellula europaea 6C]|uniref:Uncharacterized protein n=1 Tax=Rhodopirellula europaea 6C TaxID=1263867 RepID=M2B250_9BACT|nr:hypothetical protein RE6C_03002 [Rhodopirellula europaea 6C]